MHKGAINKSDLKELCQNGPKFQMNGWKSLVDFVPLRIYVLLGAFDIPAQYILIL